MKKCVFCEIDEKKIENTIIEETNNFYVKPSLGSLVDGYLLIISKRHIYSMNELTTKEKIEYINLINKYREKFKNIYNKYPIIFEHASSSINTNKSSSSIYHAHTHIVNHKFINEDDIIKKTNFKKCEFNDILPNKNYILYINNNNQKYISYTFKKVSQLMRIYIADDLNISQKYNWRKYKFEENILKTIEKFK